MQKILLMVALCLLTAVHSASASDYDNNPDYYFVMNVQGYKTYLDLTSVYVQEYNPPHYQIAARLVTVGYRQNSEEQEHYIEIKYNWYTKEAYERYQDGNWRKMAQGPASSTPVAVDKVTANALFIAAYGMKFYE